MARVIAFFLVIASFTAMAQYRCGVEHQSQERRTFFEAWLKTKQIHSGARSAATIYTVPVVVHIVHEAGEAVGEGHNLHVDRIQDQLDRLNEDFRKNNPRAILGVPEVFKPIEADIQVEFILARQDPEGNPTSGITRTVGSRDRYIFPIHNTALKSEVYWPSEDYLNIWVAETNGDDPGLAIGWATFPVTNLDGLQGQGEDQPELDGVVVDTDFFGTNPNADGLFDSYGQTLTHEIGHFLGLIHIWGDGNPNDETNCETASDFCDDTPAAFYHHGNAGNAPVTNCTYPGPDTCTEDGFADMFMNFMDYTDDECLVMFTEDQKSRMRTVLENSPRRNSLLTSPGLQYPIGVLDRDLSLVSVSQLPLVVCENELTATIQLQNFGIETISSFELEMVQNAIATSITADGLSLTTGQEYTLTIPIDLLDGYTDLNWSVISINGQTDENNLNDQLVSNVTLYREESPAPFREGFDEIIWPAVSEGTNDWQAIPLNENTVNYVNGFANATTTESWLISPSFSLENFTEAGLFFDISYGVRGTSPDLFEVKVATECADVFSTLWQADLNAMGLPNSVLQWVPTDEEDWFTQFLDLTNYVGSEGIRLAFVFTNNGGNDFYLDNIELTNNSDPNQPRLRDGSFIVYPNPANDFFNITVSLPTTQDIQMELINAEGQIAQKTIYRDMLNQTIRIERPNSYGLHFIRIRGEDINQIQRILIGR